ncbi:MAG: hypothetical protein WCG06_04115, partial [Candidatus Omnitrophota bacterium]
MDSNTNAKVSRFENLAVYFLLAAASVLSSLALLRPGFIQGHDLPFQLTLVAEYASCLGQGVFPVRWAPHLEAGYGNPMFIFSPPLFPLVASVWALLSGGQLLIGIKAALLILKFIGLLGMYRLSGVFFGKKSGLVSALFFAFAPYVAIDLFTRDAFQEFAGLCLIPWVFYSMARILT